MTPSGSKKQLNIQISLDAYLALRAAAFVDDVRSASGLAAPIVEKYAVKRSRESKVAEVIRARAASNG